ncbi:hypothetical protein LX16_1438 [Stackebrandtia albiflava]|uniref:Uncharacterized protein n=1 Tax=Stackebrandtia albiflava TaxID=406432 RepID=A0A562VCW4_9ACTN|nr:hypothetical protein [Stackebrandtia albiflava]TWJ15724.1 hypothetical protein LX16_1438 [Stackebrandtia albiflava]
MFRSPLVEALFGVRLADKTSTELIAGVVGVAVVTPVAVTAFDGPARVFLPLAAVGYWLTRAALVARRNRAGRPSH